MIVGEDVVAQTTKFKYLGSLIQSDGDINEDIIQRQMAKVESNYQQLDYKVYSTELQFDPPYIYIYI